MGQSSSRLQNQPVQRAPSTNSTSPSSVVGITTELQPDSPVDVGAESSSRPQSRRSSIRKSILRYVTPSNIRSRINSTTSNPGDVRRSWRNSRRWSKAQPDSVPQHEDSHQGSSSGSSAAGPSTLPVCPLDKGKEREISSPLEEVEEQLNAMATTFDETPRSSYPISPLDSEQAPSSLEYISGAPPALNFSNLPSQNVEIMTHENALAEHSPNPSNHEMPPVSPEAATETPSQQQQQPIAAPPQQQRSASSPRQFPPPGTLVVVQGIVHTTDVSRPNNSTPSDSATSGDAPPQPGPGLDVGDQGMHRTRNRLSALLRPRSSSRPVSTIINDVPSTTMHIHPGGDSPSVSGSGSPTSSDESAHTAIATTNIDEIGDSSREPLPAIPDQAPPAVENPSTAISSSSIDVLGTLLSVAAAATAASLLTGSSEPILSSGLAPPQAGSPPRMPHHTPNASMPNLPSYPGQVPPANVHQDASAAGRSERMRQAWGTIRERLGLRPSTSTTDDARNQFQQDFSNTDAVSNPSAGDGIGLGSPTDTRELMLAEMARAFNIGLGLNGLGGLAPGSNPVNGGSEPEVVNGISISDEDSHLPSEDSESTSQRQPTAEAPTATLPPEGSFERFLVDLQIDLRTALTQTDDEPDPEQPTPVQEPFIPEPQSNRSMDDVTVNSAAPLPWNPLGASHDNSDDHHYSDNPAGQNAAAVSSDVSESLFYRDGDYADMPFLQDVTDSESELDEDEHEDDEYEDEDFQSAEHGSVQDQGRAEPSDAQHGHTSGNGRIDASGRINWWRLYRFPPIVSPPSDASSLRQHFGPTSSASASTTTHTSTLLGPSEPSHPPEPSENTPAPISETTPSHSSTREPLSQSPSQSVVPVIVVGLQSVNSEWRPDLPTQGGDEDVDFFGQPTSDLGVGIENDDDDLDGWGGQHHTGIGAGGHGLNAPTGRGRSRGWHSRAANAIRNLRPGRRNTQVDSDVQMPAASPGSRTFLIYVIGGYYPPDHSIVTGGPNILDSFEALLELADLLGHVKPPTVSKDEIEKSGLEIIKASDLPQHEQDGKVSSNCLDRCLICLDDYEPEDPIRVMTCRHAFHQNCVDEWLQKGRNNCPACRSTGVATDSHSTVPMPTPAS